MITLMILLIVLVFGTILLVALIKIAIGLFVMVGGVLFLILIIKMLFGVAGECFAGSNDQIAVSVVIDDPLPIQHHYVEQVVYKGAKKKAIFRQITCSSCGAKQTKGKKTCSYCNSAI